MVEIDLHKKLKSGMRLVDFYFAERIPAGDVIGITGPSGCGKSSLLNMISGLLRPDRSRISIDGDVLVDSSKGLSPKPRHRRIVQVFQKPLLFPNMTLFQHLDYVRDIGISFDLDYYLEAFELAPFRDVKPAFLSGGQVQRLALLMALSTDFSILLLDESFTSLDDRLKTLLIPLVVKEVKKREKILLMVSHDIQILNKYTDRIVSFPAL